jgi:hypothetical protein
MKSAGATKNAVLAANIFVIPLSDHEVQERYPQFADCLVPWRKLAALMGYTGPIAWLVEQGFTLKKHAPLVGPCYGNLSYLQDWNFDDTPTGNFLVFWVPRLAEKSTGKDISSMVEHRKVLKKSYKLPGNHATTFGSIQLQFALILAHFKRTGGERVPLSGLYAVSDSLDDGNRLVAGSFGGGGLGCVSWVGVFGRGDFGFFLLGVEKLGK